MGGGSNDPTDDYWRGVARRFEQAHPGVRVRVVADIAHEHYMSVLGTRFIGRNPPDVMLMDDVDIGDLAREGLVMPLDRFIARDPTYRSADFPPSMVADSVIGGVRYSIPWYGSFVQLTCRTDLLAGAGVEPPRTWQELVAVCRALQQRGLAHPLGMELPAAFWMINFIWQNGGEVLSPDGRQVLIDRPSVVGAVQFVHDLVWRYGFIDPALASGAKMTDLWSAGKIALMVDGAWSIGRYDRDYPQWRGRWAVAPLPAGRRDVSFFGGAHLVMSRQCCRPALAWQLMAFAVNPDNQETYADMLGSPPGNLTVFGRPDFRRRHPQVAGMQEVMRRGRNNPLAPFFSKIWYEMFANRVLDVVMKDPRADIPRALQAYTAEAQRVADEYWAIHPPREGRSP